MLNGLLFIAVLFETGAIAGTAIAPPGVVAGVIELGTGAGVGVLPG